MKAIILAAGEGKRMRPLTLTTPKPLLEIKGKKIIDYIFDAMPSEVDEVVVVVNYLAQKIKDYLGQEYKGRKINYIQGSEKGNAIGFLACQAHLKEGEKFLILHGDEPQRKEEIEECLKKPHAWVCAEVPEPKLSGIAVLDDEGRILEVEEKPENPKSNLAAMGTILIDTKIFKYKPELHSNGEYHLSSMLDQFVKNYPVYAVFGKRRSPLTKLEDLNWDFT